MTHFLDASALWAPSMALGWLVAPLAAFVAMDLLARVVTVKPSQAMRWRLGAALGLGTGIWSSKVISLSMPVFGFAVGYHPIDVFLAWALAVVVSLGGLWLAGGERGRAVGASRALAGAAVLGFGMVAVQVMTMLAIGFRPGLRWQPQGVGLAMLVATAGGALALTLVRRIRPNEAAWIAMRDVVAALVWGTAMILSQHVLMASVGLPGQTASVHARRLPYDALNLLASVGSMALLLAMLLLSRLEARMRAKLLKAEGELAQHSLRDTLTKLPNRLRFEGTLAQAVRQANARHARLALLFINIDGFKHINESAGHRGGDELLCQIATRLRSAANPHMVARVGGDEFVLLLGDNPGREGAAAHADQLLKRLSAPCQLSGQESSVTCSIGIAMYPDDGALSTLMTHAGMGMREARRTGGASCCFFEARMVSGAREQADLLRDLRQALRRHQLELSYQPKIHAPTGEVTGAEALLRWNHPRRGLISPTVFIPIAERHGLIESIGNWVIDEACRQARAWRDEGLRMRVAINLSPHQLRDPGLGARISAALKKHQINPKLLTCEITESVAMQDSEATMKFFAVLAGVGVHISIDDFGTGYSSLAYLRKLPAEELKIDSSFVCDLEASDEARKVVDAVVKLGQALNLKVVAEGVETEAQHQILRSLGCDELQGFLFAKPMSAEALKLWALNDVGPRSLVFRPSLFQATAHAPPA